MSLFAWRRQSRMAVNRFDFDGLHPSTGPLVELCSIGSPTTRYGAIFAGKVVPPELWPFDRTEQLADLCKSFAPNTFQSNPRIKIARRNLKHSALRHTLIDTLPLAF